MGSGDSHRYGRMHYAPINCKSCPPVWDPQVDFAVVHLISNSQWYSIDTIKSHALVDPTHYKYVTQSVSLHHKVKILGGRQELVMP